jgi:HAD superfamily hydrolase (TIGR01549 family)
MIKAVIFDFGQTLVDSAEGFRSAEKQVEKKIFKDVALTSWQEFLENYRKIRKQFHEKSSFSRKAVWQEVYWYYCRQCDEKLLEKWEHQYWEKVKDSTRLFPETENVLTKLTTEHSIALITNTEGRQERDKHRITLFPQLERFFDTIIIAGESGIPAKPDPAPFLLCLKRLGVSADEAVYVGDDWYIDICGARDAGIRPIWLKHHLVNRTWPDVKETVPIFTSLDQLLDLESVIKN